MENWRLYFSAVAGIVLKFPAKMKLVFLIFATYVSLVYFRLLFLLLLKSKNACGYFYLYFKKIFQPVIML